MFSDKIIKYLLYLSLFLPLVFVNYSMYPWHFGKTVYFQIFIEILLVLAICSFLFYKRAFKKLVLLDWLVLGFLFSQLLSAVLGLNFNKSFWGDQQRASGVFSYIHFVIFYFLLRQFLTTKKDWMRVGLVAVSVGLVSSLIAWLGGYLSVFAGVIEQNGRLSGVIGNSIFFANYLTIPVFLAFAFHFFNLESEHIHTYTRKFFYPIAGIIGFVSLLYAQSRGAFLGVLTGAFLVFLVLIFSKTLSTRARKIFAGIGIVLVLLFVGVYALNQTSVVVRTISPDLGRLLDIRAGETTARTRLMAWDIAIEGWKENIILGYGPENYQDIFDAHYNPEFLKYSFAETVWDKPHNYFLETLGAQGVLGALFYIAIILTALYYIKRAFLIEQNKNKKIFLIVLAGAIVGYVMQLLFLFETSNSLQLWFVLLALTAYFPEIQQKPVLVEVKNKILLQGIFGVIIAISFFAIHQNYSMLKSSYHMSLARDSVEILSTYQWKIHAQKAITVPAPFIWENAVFLTKDLSTFDGHGQLNPDILHNISKDIEKVFLTHIEMYPHSYLYRFWLSQLYAFMGEYLDNKYYAQSERYLKEAGEISEGRQHIPLLLSKNYLLQGEYDRAILVLEDLVAQNPAYNEPHWFLGVAYMGGGEREKGIAEMERGKAFGLGFDSNVLYMIDVYREDGTDESYRKTIPLYQMLIDENPENANFYHDIAIMYMVTGDQEKSLEYFKQSLNLNPTLQNRIEEFFKVNNINVDLLK